jgi:serine/threonine-protein kinase
MGVVYKAREERLNRTVALKMILSGGHAADRDLTRFRREVEAVAALQHPNIVQIHAVGEADGLPYCALEYVSNGTLADCTRSGPLPPKRSARLIATLARAVHAAHGRNVVHRDLKPANVLLTEDGTPKITDFGLAKRLGTDGTGPTAPGVILGTPSYMAPEQAGDTPKAIGPPADVYALGAILYYLLTGQPPFTAATTLETVLKVLNEEPAPPRRLNASVPRDLETVCLMCLRKEPGNRYGSASELAEDLDRFLAGEPVRARPLGLGERLTRLARRHRPALAGAAVASAMILLIVALRPAAAPPPSSTAPDHVAPSPVARPPDFTPVVLERVRKSAALIRVSGPADKVESASGWVAEKQGDVAYVITNAHVVGMKEPAKPAPERIEVILESGSPNERKLEGRLVALNREEDLALICIKGKELPDPLPIAPSYDLQEGQKLLILGFPNARLSEGTLKLGDGSVSALKLRLTTVAGRIRNKSDGSVKYIQVEGGGTRAASAGPQWTRTAKSTPFLSPATPAATRARSSPASMLSTCCAVE